MVASRKPGPNAASLELVFFAPNRCFGGGAHISQEPGLSDMVRTGWPWLLTALSWVVVEDEAPHIVTADDHLRKA